jgi:hypothetical protein
MLPSSSQKIVRKEIINLALKTGILIPGARGKLGGVSSVASSS